MATQLRLEEQPADPSPLAGESDFEFFARRAMDEAHAARRAACPKAAAAHMYLANAYAAEVAREMARAAELEALALAIDRCGA